MEMHYKSRFFRVLALLVVLSLSVPILATVALQAELAHAATSVFMNELHYDNSGTDTGEAIEIAGPAGTDLTNWQIVLYNGTASQRSPYNTRTLSGTIPDLGGGFGVVVETYPSNGIQNGAPDGIALVDNNGVVVQFLSYEGSFEAASGPAAGMTSTNIGVSEGSSTPEGDSLQLTGNGSSYEDFTWAAPAANTFGSFNTGQSFDGDTTPTPTLSPTPSPTPEPAGCGNPATLIHEIQGSGLSSPKQNEVHTIEGVVVGDFQETLDGFFLQEGERCRIGSGGG